MNRLRKIALIIALLPIAACGKAGTENHTLGEVDKINASDLHPCKVTATELTNEDCQAAQDWLDQAKTGSASVRVPILMRQGETTDVRLAIGTAPPKTPTFKAAPDNTTENTITTDTSDPRNPYLTTPPSTVAGEPEGAAAVPSVDSIAAQGSTNKHDKIIPYNPLVGRRMKAELTGDGFEIKLLSDLEQQVTDKNITTWDWRVKAVALGQKSLHLSTSIVMFDSQQKTDTIVGSTFDKSIKVTIGVQTILDWLADSRHWIITLTSVITAAGGLVLAIRRFGRDRSEHTP